MPTPETTYARILQGLLATLLFAACLTGCARGPWAERQQAPRPAEETRAPTQTTPTPAPAAPETPTVFAVIGDYGTDDANSAAVAALVASWRPAFIVTTGDNYYKNAGGTGTAAYDESTGAYYGRWLADITTTGRRLPSGRASVNAFFPAMGNHDYNDAKPSPRSYLTYFRLPGRGFTSSSGNERYYDFVQGPVHFFVLNSNTQEPDGITGRSEQARWLRSGLAKSTSPWQVVIDHHPPFSSDSRHGSSLPLRWPYSEWGADVMISGHSHTYERIHRDGLVYFVNGLGGAKRYSFGRPIAGSQARYQATWGAQRVTATRDRLDFRFYDVEGKLIDRYRLRADR